MALSPDGPTAALPDTYRSSSSPYPRASNSSPGPRLPGYIPGMPRPMTPRDHDSSLGQDEQSPSATPRARSPGLLPGSNAAQPQPLLAQSDGACRQVHTTVLRAWGSPDSVPNPSSTDSENFLSRSRSFTDTSYYSHAVRGLVVQAMGGWKSGQGSKTRRICCDRSV